MYIKNEFKHTTRSEVEFIQLEVEELVQILDSLLYCTHDLAGGINRASDFINSWGLLCPENIG